MSSSPTWTPNSGGCTLTWSDEGIYVLEASKSNTYSSLNKATIALLKGSYKLICYLGYRYYRDKYEFYDLENDPEELANLYPTHPAASEMQAELERTFAEINRPYSTNQS